MGEHGTPSNGCGWLDRGGLYVLGCPQPARRTERFAGRGQRGRSVTVFAGNPAHLRYGRLLALFHSVEDDGGLTLLLPSCSPVLPLIELPPKDV